MKKLKKGIRIFCSVLWYFTVAVLALVLIHVGSARLRHEIPSFGGYCFFRIVTESMEPAIPAGTYILVKQTPAEEIRQGDIITYYSEDPAIYGMPNTHRVAGPPQQSPDGIRFRTRGDNNLIDDELTVRDSQLIGRYVCSLTGLSAFINFFVNPDVLIILLIVQGLCVVMMLITVKIMRLKRKNQEGDSK